MRQEPLDSEQTAYFEGLYSQYAAIMYKSAMEICRDGNISKDVVQDTFIRLFRQYDTLTRLEAGALTVYIVRAVRNTALNAMRGSSAEISLEELDGRLPDTGTPPEDTFIYSQQDAAVRRALQGLTLEERLLLEERYILRTPIAEIAEIYGYSAVNVRVKLTRLRKRILEELIKEGYSNAEE